MASSLFNFLSFLRPDDAELSEQEAWLVQVYRFLSVVGGALIPVFRVLYALLPAAYVDPWWARFGMTGMFGALFASSYVFPWVRRHYTGLMWGCLYVLLAWIGTVTALNQAAGDYAVAFLFVFCVVGVCIGIGLQHMGPLIWFLGYALFLTGSIYLVVPAPETSAFALVGCTATLSVVLYVIFQARLSMRQQLQAAREEAKTASRLKSALLANMSHEVRTPLTSILGFAELIADADPDNPEALAHSIRRSGRRLLDTLDAVLQVSRLESGAVDLQPESLNLAAVVAERVDTHASKAAQNDVQLEFVRADAAVEARVDVDATERIVDELVRNAIDFSETGDRARVWVEGHPEHVTIVVEDTGVGMSEECLDDLVRPFEQASVGQDRTHEGAGLGLTVTHRLVRLMGGSIEVDSEKGSGTRIAVRLPRDTEVTDPEPSRVANNGRTPVAA